MTWEEYERNVPLVCPRCDWKGGSKEAQLKLPDETVGELFCPQCGEYEFALLDSAPSRTEIEQRAANGDAWYQKLLENEKLRQETLLRNASGLPDLEDLDELHFVWDAEGSEETEVWTVIRLKEGKPVWKERASFGGKTRFEEVRKMLEEKYKERFKSFEINFANYLCGIYYYGD